MMKIGYLGPVGTYSHRAAVWLLSAFELHAATLTPFPSILDLLDGLDQHEIHAAVAPLENSIEGSVLVTLDRLRLGEMTINAELTIPIRHGVFTLPGVDPSEIRVVRSHPQALAQCRNTLRRLFPSARHEDADSTAGALHSVAQERNRTLAAVGSFEAGRDLPLVRVVEDAQDHPYNETRFALLTRRATEFQEDGFASVGEASAALPRFSYAGISRTPVYKKTSILLELGDDHPGALFEVLRVLARDGINLSKLESRPSRRGLGSYHFFLDLLLQDEPSVVDQALAEIATLTGFVLHHVGSYPCFREDADETASQK